MPGFTLERVPTGEENTRLSGNRMMPIPPTYIEV
jgi:hypothetical protein